MTVFGAGPERIRGIKPVDPRTPDIPCTVQQRRKVADPDRLIERDFFDPFY